VTLGREYVRHPSLPGNMAIASAGILRILIRLICLQLVFLNFTSSCIIDEIDLRFSIGLFILRLPLNMGDLNVRSLRLLQDHSL